MVRLRTPCGLSQQCGNLAERGLEGYAAHLEIRLLAGDAHGIAHELAGKINRFARGAAV